MSNQKKLVPAYYSYLEIENIRCFGTRQRLELTNKAGVPARWTLLLGDNGVGKTTVLECLAWMRPVPSGGSDLQQSSAVKIKPILDDIDDNSEIDALIRSGKNVRACIKTELARGTRLDSTRPSSRRPTIMEMYLERKNNAFESVENIESSVPAFDELNVYAYSANRHMQANYFDPEEYAEPDVHLFTESGDLYDAEQALLNLEYMALKKDRRAQQLFKKLKDLLVDLLPTIEKASDIDIVGPVHIVGEHANRGGVQIETPTGRVPLSKLSLGYKTVFAWAVDFALRMFFKHPNISSPLEQSAIVLIDEIDLHLHPKWQRAIRSRLTESFPNTQFICTAHSPLMAQEAADDNVAVLIQRGSEVHIENDPVLVRGWRVDQILTSELFGVDSARSSDVQKLIDERRSLLQKKKLTAAQKKRLKVLDKLIEELPVAESEDEKRVFDLLSKAATAIEDQKH